MARACNRCFQAKLLRVLQERKIQRVGGSEEHGIDVRIVAATNRDLRADIGEGRFRKDLYFRLAVIPIQLAPLRERPEDILPLAEHFLEKWNRDLHRSLLGWTPEVEQHLEHHSWPGNVRELENAIERGVVLARTDRIEIDDLLLETEASETTIESSESLQAYLDRATADKIRSALESAGGVRVDAARSLRIDRTTLYRLMRKFDVNDGIG